MVFRIAKFDDIHKDHKDIRCYLRDLKTTSLSVIGYIRKLWQKALEIAELYVFLI